MTDSLVLLPAPQKMTPLAGTFSPAAGRLIYVAGDSAGTPDDDLLRAARHVQDTLDRLSQRWELTAARLDGLQVGATVRVDPAQVAQPQGYRLIIGPEGLLLVAHDAAGAYYGAMTLRQIARQAQDSALPCLRIDDWPDYPQRGVMLDISRDKVPRIDTLTSLIEMLAEWKVNQVQLYTEHTYAYRNHATVWEQASPLSGEEILLLDAYCKKRFIELVPNQNSFGHMTRWLKHAPYAHLAEAPGGFDFPWGRHSDEPFSLCPTDPATLDLLDELFAELLPHFSSRQFNVGCDETWDVGQPGTRSEAVTQAVGAGRVYLDFLQQVYQRVTAHGRTMQFWGDIILKHPELIAELPQDAIAMEWGYEADHPFAANCAAFAAAGVPFYVCPGTSSWNAIGGRTDNAIGNLWNAAEHGLEHGAIGYLNTDWGDNGHWQPLPVSFLGFAYGAAVSWAAQPNRELDLPAALDRHAFQDEAGVMGRAAHDLGNAYLLLDRLPNNTPFSQLLLRPEATLADAWLSTLSTDGLLQAQEAIEAAVDRLDEARSQRLDGALIRDEFRLAARLMLHACKLGIARLAADDQAIANIPAGTRADLALELDDLLAEYTRVWMARNRPGGLVDSVGRLENLRAAYGAAE